MDLIHAFGWLFTPAHWWGEGGVLNRLWEQIQYALLATALAAAIGVPLGLLVGHTRRGIFISTNAAGLLRAVPTLGVLILVYKLRPVSAWPVLVALTILAVPPILTNTAVGIAGVEDDVRDAAEGMGMTGWQVLSRAELPMALPLIMAGIRSAASQVIATATIAAYVGLGGLGRFIIDGIAFRDFPMVYGGAIAVALLALVVEGLLALLQRRLVSPGLRTRAQRAVTYKIPGTLVPELA